MMFVHVFPMAVFIAMLAVFAFTADIAFAWKILWWLSGVMSVWVLANFKGEDFGCSPCFRWIIFGIIGILGFTIVPFALTALVLDYRLCFNVDE